MTPNVTRIAKTKYGVSVAADESCRSLADAKEIVKRQLADVINIKLAKVGVLGALEIIDFAKVSGLDLMICDIIDLDTPLLLSEDPVFEGYEVSGPTYKFTNARGHGGFLHWDNITWFIALLVW
ncbi:hypothetical protein L1987_37789 [Smallanthus sonchifolius]|uniref:Uncharacterized protein n=1 Tax=Smallanthus sonchifolius TaxID=185202 RepID=A0ACB9HI13_9ASTR|nr:hypothetical protein L1987_37789 [Smallanthus sonchifolius]